MRDTLEHHMLLLMDFISARPIGLFNKESHMKKNSLSFLTVLPLCFILTGCGINASIDPMTYHYHHKGKPKNQSIVHAITVDEVTGGHSINPLLASEISNESYKMALEKSLQSADLFKQDEQGKYSLKAKIVRFERPVMGLDFKSTLIVHYQLHDIKHNKEVFNKTIKSSYVAKFNDSIIAVTRLKLANEGAARENIKQLIGDLYKDKL